MCYLSKQEQDELCDFLMTVGEIGYGKTRKQIKDIAEKVACEKGVLKRGCISNGWFRKFMERNRQLALRRGDATSGSHMTVISQKVEIENYYLVLKEVLDEKGLIDKPAQIYNVDETGMPLDHRHLMLLFERGKIRFVTAPLETKVKSLLLVVLMLPTQQYHHLLYLMQRISKCSGQRVKYQAPHMV